MCTADLHRRWQPASNHFLSIQEHVPLGTGAPCISNEAATFATYPERVQVSKVGLGTCLELRLVQSDLGSELPYRNLRTGLGYPRAAISTLY